MSFEQPYLPGPEEGSVEKLKRELDGLEPWRTWESHVVQIASQYVHIRANRVIEVLLAVSGIVDGVDIVGCDMTASDVQAASQKCTNIL
jgi:hypothetical protein